MNADEVIEKIKKAVRLANKTTEQGEKDTAMRLAKQLADKHGIALDSLEIGENQSKAVKMEDSEQGWYSGSEIGPICYIIREHFGVIVMLCVCGNGKHSLTWFGNRLNIEISKFVFHILRRESLKAWEEHRKVTKLKIESLRKRVLNYRLPVSEDLLKPKFDKNSFMQGFFYAINEKLKKNPLRNDIAEAKREAERKLDEYRADHNVQDKSKKGADLDTESVMRGVSAGSKVNLSRPCEGRETVVKMID